MQTRNLRHNSLVCVKDASGFLLIDVLLAMSLSIIFIYILSSSYNNTNKIFQLQYEKSKQLDLARTSELVMPAFLYASDLPLCAQDFVGSQSSSTYLISSSQISLPISSALPLTHLQMRNNIAYISADSAVSSDPDFFVIDISNPLSPQIISSLNTGPGISSFSVAGKYIFASAASTAFQLHVIDISDRRHPFLESKFKLPPPYATATLPMATAIAHDNDGAYQYVILGTEKWDGAELSIINVSNPASSVFLGGIEVGSQVNDIFIYGDIANIASAGADQLLRVDVNNPTGPYIIDSFSPSGWSRQEGRAVNIYEDKLVFGRTSGGYDIATDHELFSWPTSTATLRTSLSSFSASSNITGGIYGIIQDRSRVITASRQAGKEIQIFKKGESGDRNIALDNSFSVAAQPRTMTCDAGKIYVLSLNNPTIYGLSFK
jgi:hypothetical protein